MSEFPLDPSQYELRHLIGAGTSSRVYEAKCLTNGRTLAIKQINLENFPLALETIEKQTAFWVNCKHPNIVCFYGSFVSDCILWILTELMSCGSISDILKYKYPNGIKDEKIIRFILTSVVNGINHFHSNEQIHRDIRTKNILINSQGQVKLSDFGLATSLIKSGKRRMSTLSLYGETCYMAPEILKDESYSQKTDIWSIGLTAIELATGKPPFDGMTFMESLTSIIQGKIPTLPNDHEFSSNLRQFINSCLVYDPEKRVTSFDLAEYDICKDSLDISYFHDNLVSKLPTIWERSCVVTNPVEEAPTTPPKDSAKNEEVEKRGRFTVKRSPSVEISTKTRNMLRIEDLLNEIDKLKATLATLENENEEMKEHIIQITAAVRNIESS